jgi:peptidoglycan/xylan/chitin deacetylase (PgdA/CDA1 family)
MATPPRGQYGLPFQLRMLDEHRLHGVFMVETLFTHGYGIEPLREIVELIQGNGREVQLHSHLHPEWITAAATVPQWLKESAMLKYSGT